MAHAPEKLMTAEELYELGDIGRCELIRGELIRMSPAGFQHGRIGARICRILTEFVETHDLGVVTNAETGYRIRRDPDTVRDADAAFVKKARLPRHEVIGFFEGPPDLAVEVVSPHDSWSEINAKAEDWLGAGCEVVWLVDPKTQCVTIRSSHSTQTLKSTDLLEGGALLPGFRFKVGDIFDVRS